MERASAREEEGKNSKACRVRGTKCCLALGFSKSKLYTAQGRKRLTRKSAVKGWRTEQRPSAEPWAMPFQGSFLSLL